MALAHQLIDTLASKWDPTQYRDTYTDVLRKAIEAKVEGKEVVVEEGPRRPKVANLMKALQESLKEGDRKEPARAVGRTKPAPRRGSRKAA